ncbi:hypothetical protein O6H91_06G145400 [Diphasiastrum complanatum]|uniref:Uncharacterized protein n=1 Tax=Diphasiastrum complanatum TaxID=34168 RepID=A0ACC2DJV3_DIPCM|nr:hypothetical protein O6H91_06G145400 [Diphasiastrum complanatum]
MADRGLNFFHHKKEDEAPKYAEDGTLIVETATVEVHGQDAVKGHSTKEHISEAAALVAGGYALYESHRAKTDSDNAGRHKLEEEIVAATAAGAALFGVHEHHAKKTAKKAADE